MLYKLIIVDDERIIREGLRTIVNWHDLGFEVVGVFADGQEAIDYITSTPVDAVLTDIKMTFVSGIEVAKYIHENNLNSKVVLLSGYKEFDFALNAITYGVENYLLKPTDISKLHAVFLSLRKELDKKNNHVIEKERLKETLLVMREKFFVDLLMGSINEERYLYKILKVIYPNIDPNHCICFTADINIMGYNHYVEKDWKYGKNEFFSAIKNMITARDGEIQYHIIFKTHETFRVFGVFIKKQMNHMLAIDRSLHIISKEIMELFGLDSSYLVREVYDSMLEIIQNINSVFLRKVQHPPGKIIEVADMNKLKEQQKLLLSNISIGNIDGTRNIFRSFLNALTDLDIRIMRNRIIEMFAVIAEKLKEASIDVYEVTDGKFNYNIIATMKDIEEIEKWGREVLGSLAKYVLETKENQTNDIISRAQKYIEENCFKDLSLEEVAEHYYLSPCYFSRIFKKQAGESFIDYLIKVRMELAVRLLKDSQYKVYQIAEMIGYKSNRYFSRTFKTHTGYTPSEYRNIVLCERGDEKDVQ